MGSKTLSGRASPSALGRPTPNDRESLLAERFNLITRKYLRPLTRSESARMKALESSLAALENAEADEFDRSREGTRASRLDASLDRLENYIVELKSHSR